MGYALFVAIVAAIFLFGVLIVPVLVEEIHKGVARRRAQVAMNVRHGHHRQQTSH
jgi:hypothetical protein